MRTGSLAQFPRMAESFDSTYIEGLLFKLTVLEFRSHLVKVITSYLLFSTFVPSFWACRDWSRAGGLISPVLFNLHVNSIPIPSRHIELAQYSDNNNVQAAVSSGQVSGDSSV